LEVLVLKTNFYPKFFQEFLDWFPTIIGWGILKTFYFWGVFGNKKWGGPKSLGAFWGGEFLTGEKIYKKMFAENLGGNFFDTHLTLWANTFGGKTFKFSP